MTHALGAELPLGPNSLNSTESSMAALCRLAAPPIQFVRPCAPQPLPPPSTVFQKQGLRFERNASAALARLAGRIGATFLPQQWFEFADSNGPGRIALDGVFQFSDFLLCIEVKLTWVPIAEVKLRELYVPLLRETTRRRVFPLVLCRNLTPSTPLVIDSLSRTIAHDEVVPTLSWLGHGPIPWTA